MSEVKLDANGLIVNKVISGEIETQTLKLGEGVLSEDTSGSLAWNGENFLTNATGLNEGIIPCFPVSTTVPPYTDKLCIQKASTDNAPNNGVILSTYTNTNWSGQLCIIDNGNQGLYVRGVSNGVQVPWKQVLHLENSASSGNWYRKYSDGLIIQSGTIATTANDSDTSTITLPTAFTSANYYANVMLENIDMNGGGGMWTVKWKTTTSFIIHNGQDYTGTFRWFAIGY